MAQANRPAALFALSTAIPALAWLVFLIFAAWLASYWYWRLAAPPVERAIAAPITDPLAAANEVASRHLFGRVQQEMAAPGAPVAAVFSSRYKVLGVAANSRGAEGFAIVQADGEAPVAVVEGAEIAPGVVLSRVLPTGIEVSRGGATEMIPLTREDSGAAAGSVTPGAPTQNFGTPGMSPGAPPSNVTPGAPVPPPGPNLNPQ